MNEDRYGTRYLIGAEALRFCKICGSLVQDMTLHDDFHSQLDALANATSENIDVTSRLKKNISSLQGAAFNSGGRW